MQDPVKAIVDIIQGQRVSQDQKISNEMLLNYSPERLKIEKSRMKSATLAILSTQLKDKVTEVETPDPAVHTIDYSGYFINEEQFNEIKELLGWTDPEAETESQAKASSQDTQSHSDQTNELV